MREGDQNTVETYKSTHSLEYLTYEIAFGHKQLGEDDCLERYMDAKKSSMFQLGMITR